MPLYSWTARRMVEALAEGEVTSVDLVEALHARADVTEPAVNGFTARYREASLAAARDADAARARGEATGPLFGMPISIKENLAYEGTPQTLGVTARAERLAPTSLGVVAAALGAGAVVLGKTNVPQLLLSTEADNALFGRTGNPWDTRRVPGGSSGGEAAVVACGASPWGLGTDIGGSIRNPAAWCGVVGLKPTWGRWSVAGSAGGQPGQEAVRAQSGPIARTVGDVALLFDTLVGAPMHAADPRVPPLPAIDPATVDLSGLTIGVYEDDGVFLPAASVRRAVRLAADALEAAGARVVAYTPPRSWEMVDAYFGLLSADGVVTARQVMEGDDVTPQLATLVRLGTMPSALRKGIAALLPRIGEPRVGRLVSALGEKRVSDLWALVRARDALQAAELAAWDAAGIDAVVGPPTVTPAALPAETGDWSLGAWHTMRWNLLDQPAGVLPVSTVQSDEQVREVLDDRLDRKAARFEADSAGLPVAAQVIGRPWEEHVVLAVMAAIEAGREGAHDTPVTPIDPRGPRPDGV